jgi:putative ABC transport system permease protein
MAARNVRKSVRDFGVYFLTIAIGVAMFYVFNSIDGQSIMMELSENEYAMLLGLDTAMTYLSAVISAVLGFLMLYANAFLIRRRKKELGIYMTLGMEKGKISRILICETTIVGLISLAVGLVIGIVVSQGIAILTAKLYEFSLKSGFAFVFSADALWKSIVYFGVAFVIVMIFNTANISRQELIDLIYADKKGSKFRAPHFRLSIALCLFSVAMLAAAYYMAVSVGFTEIFAARGVAPIALGVAGTFLFFYSFAGFFLKLVFRLQNVYFKGLNLFTLGQLNSKMNTAHLSMSLVCLMLFLSISFISIGYALDESIKVGFGESSAIVTYITFYIGLVFMLACASLLAIAQLSEASDNRTLYGLLSKLGASKKMLAGSLLVQIALYFALPLIVAVAHSIVAVAVMGELVVIVGEINVWATCLIAGLVVVALYGGYFAMTYHSAKKMALPG